MLWYWRGVEQAQSTLDETEIETGDPPQRGRRVFAEPLSTYALSGTETEPKQAARVRHGWRSRETALARRTEEWATLTDEELCYIEETWARLPRWDDVKRSLLTR